MMKVHQLVSAVMILSVAVGVTGCRSHVPTGAGAPADGTAASGPALSALQRLTIRPDGSMSTYNRIKDFGPAWTDSTGAPGGHNHCDTRDDILERDLTAVHRDGSCTVTSGTLHDPYTGKTIHFRRGRATSSAVQIDHLVSVAATI
jgi:hypothetical protein